MFTVLVGGKFFQVEARIFSEELEINLERLGVLFTGVERRA